MCLILFAYQLHPNYPLVLAANRDEFYQRPTEPVHWWLETPDLLAGKDLQAGGTWMGLTRSGRFAAITNVREPGRKTEQAKSRGLLPLDFLQGDVSASDFSAQLEQSRDQYNGYNLLFGEIGDLHYFSNRHSQQSLQPGLYGLSNARLDTGWPKVERGKEMLRQKLAQQKLSTDELQQILATTDIAPDDQLPDTGISLEWERLLSAICIQGENYGTRSSTVLLVDKQGHVCFHEKQIAPHNSSESRIKFKLDPPNKIHS